MTPRLVGGASKRGIRILYILDYSNRLYESDRSVRTEKGRNAFNQRLDLDSDKDFAFKLTKDNNVAIAIWTIGREHKVTLPPLPRFTKKNGGAEIKIIYLLGKEEKTINSAWKDNGLELAISQNPQYLLINSKSQNPPK